jgi:hypothetical protein
MAIFLIAACGSAHDRLVATGVAYAYQLPTHCGVLEAWFEGRMFYVESLYPSDVASGLDQPVDTGTMVLLAPHLAAFQDATGHHIRFVDSPPGVIGQAYPFTVHVLAGTNQLIDEHFAARVWRAQGALSGVIGPPYGNGHDAYTSVNGTLTLLSTEQAIFTSPSATVEFDRIPAFCD